ncbi:uncharacterized protein LOC122876757 [Siniperca chuatsi]|uniref:uncharacterized protein LOC122876757 n=1 Tax=Siniperca chuatsi TaxID=119488 RepID=UPI001CE2300F|nr:uncharacterized protein LOC122876757 [Siniperca chuatsi]
MSSKLQRTWIKFGMMAGRMKTWKTLRLLILFSLLSLTEPFEVRDDEWEELRPDVAALHRLRGLPEHMFHERLKNPSNQRDTPIHGARAARSSSWVDIDQNPKSLQDDLQECEESFTACVIQMEQGFDSFLAAIDEQKIQDWLLSASEISHSYGQKLLVMTDKEKSTNDRVQREYSMDPHYSVIVSNECLYNVSCVPEADSHTVVKIFGSVSEDGQTVSGLSGSSLAELMLKPSLKAVPLFSLDGKTTTNFQHNFIQVFKVRGIKAVLETTQENHQIYQVINQLDSVSGYQIPQRPVDHTTQYDHQQILIMEDDHIVKKAATYLHEKHPTVSSVCVLDKNQKPKLIHGASVPLSEDSRLVLVGHGMRDNSEEMRLAGYTASDVTKIIQQTFRVGDKIKTISVVGCEVGSDKAFIETLLRGLQAAGIEAELHLRDAVLQVRHTGEKITQEISTEGLQWRHKDDSKKVVATLDRNGDVIIRKDPGSKGEAIFTKERNFLIFNRDSWPSNPQTFIDRKVFEKFENADQIRNACDELEALSWGFFHADLPLPQKINIENLQQIEEHYLIGKKTGKNGIQWIVDEKALKDVLSKCYEIKSGKDVRNVIRHYAKNGENEPTYLMVNDWIYEVNPDTLYVYPVGKKLDNNQRENEDKIKKVKECIVEQIGKEKYKDMRKQILPDTKNTDTNINPKERYAQHVKNIFLGEHTTHLPLSTEAWYTTYFTASVISESARNFRTFPLVLMALDMVESSDNNIREKGQNFFLDGHSMARGGSWIDTSRRGFRGSATTEGSSKLRNSKRSAREKLMTALHDVIEKEFELYQSWISRDEKDISSEILKIAEKYKITESNPTASNHVEDIFPKDYETFKTEIKDRSGPSASGTLGGYNDGHVTSQDLKSATELENSFKLESYFSRARVLSAEQIHNQIKAKYGENLAELHLQEGSARMENGQFICHLVSQGADAKPVEFRVELSPESQRYNEKMLKSIDTAVHDLENHGSVSSHQVNKYVEHTGTAVGTLGLMLGMKGAVRAFEQGDIEDGVVGTLQTAHGVTAMTTSVIARQTLSSETRIAKAAATIIKSPAMKGTMTAIPMVGIGFGIYYFKQDLIRGDTLGYTDAALDGVMIALDVIEIVQPELAPFIAPINLALSVVRMVIDDVYMGIQNELNSLPKNAGVLERLMAVLHGSKMGTLNFNTHVASFFYNWHYEEIEEGHRLVAQISDYHKYYTVTKEQDGMSAIDFSGGDSSWNGGNIQFCLTDQGQSELCMDYFVSSDESFTKKCWNIDTDGSKDIILGLGESHQLEHKTLQNKILMFIPAGSVTVVSGYEAVSKSRFGIYKGNRDSNRFFAIQKAEDQHMIEVMLSYYYKLYGEPGDDIFFLGPQRSYVKGSGGKDTYIVPENGGKTIINNYDPSKALDTLHFSVDYSHISASKSGDDVVLMYEDSHTVTIQGWFLGELYRHMNMMSGDGVLFEISSTVVSSVQLAARGINKMFKIRGETVNASQPLLSTVTNIFGSRYDDELIGNGEKNLIDGGGGRDHLIGGEGEDTYIVKERQQSSVLIENYSRDNKTDLAIIEANLQTFKVRVEGDNVVLNAFHDNTAVHVTLVRWFRSPADRHLLVVTKDLITFTISDNKADCRQSDPFTKCIKSCSIDYSSSPSALVVDLQDDKAFDSVTEVRGSEFNDVIRGNKERNVVVPGRGNDFIQGRGGEDWFVITPGQGVKTIDNQSPDLALDVLFLKEQYQHITCTCEGQSIIILVYGRRDVVLQNWFKSKTYQHLQIKTSDGITAGLMPNLSSCGESLMLPLTVDYRNQKPEPLNLLQTHLQKRKSDVEDVSVSSGYDGCFRYRSKNSEERVFCGLQGKVMMMNKVDSVKEMYGSSGFDIMVGNSNENLFDPYTEGALMFGGEGKDTYIIKHGYGNNLMIDNFAEDKNIDTVLVDMDFLDGSQVELDSSTGDLNVMITTKGEQLKFSLLNYNNGYQHQHLEFQSSDGVNFKLKSLNSTGSVPFFHIEAFKVTLKQSQGDCRLDLNSQRNLSKVHTVQGCPSQSNDILGNDQANALIGGWKDDALEGGEGDDTLIGGYGDDILSGDVGDDTLYGEDGNDTMMGNSGWDVFIPGPGADLVDGGPGRDTVLYRGDHDTGKGVYVNLLTGQGRYADAEGDVLKDVETVIGTIYSDILVSGYESSLLKGSDGNDMLVSTGGDYLVGGDGNDIYMLAFDHGSVTIDNCAKDSATDVLYLSSQSTPIFDCQLLSDRVLLTFFGFNQTTVNITLEGWIGDDNECGHLKLVFREKQVSVDRLLQQCQLRWKEAVWSLVISSVICISLVLFHCVIILQTCRKSVLRARQQKTQEQTETNVDAESVSMMPDVM